MDKRVTGIGGIFFKAKDPKAMYEWYAKHLGLNYQPEMQFVDFEWKDCQTGEEAHTYWSLFKNDTKYLDPSTSSFMINYRVADLDTAVCALESEGITILGRQADEYGKFAWILDPEGNKIELFEPPKED
jgi:catechol 2,3-dioxygenase-like lactoylglutathione lyase family enzyme